MTSGAVSLGPVPKRTTSRVLLVCDGFQVFREHAPSMETEPSPLQARRIGFVMADVVHLEIGTKIPMGEKIGDTMD